MFTAGVQRKELLHCRERLEMRSVVVTERRYDIKEVGDLCVKRSNCAWYGHGTNIQLVLKLKYVLM